MYFEFDDARRLHQPYQDLFYKIPAWKAPAYNSPYLNWRRGVYSMGIASVIMEPTFHFFNHVKIMNYFYEWPRTRTEYNIFFKEVFRMQDFWPELMKKMMFGLLTAAGDTAPKLAMWQYIYGGTWSPQDYVDSNSWKHLACAVITALPTCWTGLPFENARRAYFADKTWPIELRKGYTSPTNALIRIPFEEGPIYLFKNGLPLMLSSFLFWSGFFTYYSFMKNKFFFLWTYNDFPYNYIKGGMMGIGFLLSSLLSYPFYYMRSMLDLWPKERGGHCTWNNSYRECVRWFIDNIDTQYYNLLTGYWRWVGRYGLTYLIGIWIADNMGMFSNCNEAWASVDVQFPIWSEST